MSAVFNKLDKLKFVYDVIYKIAMVICKVLLVADIIITSIAVLGRYTPIIGDPSWSEEVVLTCMIYMTVISAAMAIRRHAHIRMTGLDKYLPENLIRALDIIADLAVMVFAIVLVVKGSAYAIDIGGRGTYTSMPWLSKFWLYVSVPLAGIFMIVFEIESLYDHIKVCFTKGEEIK